MVSRPWGGAAYPPRVRSVQSTAQHNTTGLKTQPPYHPPAEATRVHCARRDAAGRRRRRDPAAGFSSHLASSSSTVQVRVNTLRQLLLIQRRWIYGHRYNWIERIFHSVFTINFFFSLSFLLPIFFIVCSMFHRTRIHPSFCHFSSKD